MPFFKRSQPAPPPPVPPRSVPQLHPDTYRDALQRADKPVTEHNVIAIAEFTAWNLALNAHAWFQALGDLAAEGRFDGRFNADSYQPDRLGNVPDDMIDFLWAWNPRVHPALHDFVSQVSNTIDQKLSGYGDVLPMRMWQDE